MQHIIERWMTPPKSRATLCLKRRRSGVEFREEYHEQG